MWVVVSALEMCCLGRKSVGPDLQSVAVATTAICQWALRLTLM
jgi:hypothetical protein